MNGSGTLLMRTMMSNDNWTKLGSYKFLDEIPAAENFIHLLINNFSLSSEFFKNYHILYYFFKFVIYDREIRACNFTTALLTSPPIDIYFLRVKYNKYVYLKKTHTIIRVFFGKCVLPCTDRNTNNYPFYLHQFLKPNDKKISVRYNAILYYIFSWKILSSNLI